MNKTTIAILSMMMIFLLACNLSTTPASTDTPQTTPTPDIPTTNLATFTDSTVGFRFNYPASLEYISPVSTVPYFVTIANFDFMDERYLSGEITRPVDSQIIELSVSPPVDGISTLDDLQNRTHESFDTMMFIGTTLHSEERRSIGSGLQANVYFLTLRDGTDTIMAETLVNGHGLFFRAFGGSEVIDTILNSLVIE